MGSIRQFEVETPAGHPVGSRDRRTGNDVHVLVGQRICHVPQETCAVEGGHFHGGPERGRAPRLDPVNFDDPIRRMARERCRFGTILTMDGNASLFREKTGHLIAECRMTTGGHPHDDVVGALDTDRSADETPGPVDTQVTREVFGVFVSAQDVGDTACNIRSKNDSLADVGEKCVDIGA